MTLALFLTFTFACVLLAVTPGPNMALIIAHTLGGGLRGGLTTLLGTLSGLSILVAVAAIGMTSIMVLMSEWFDVIRWVGALYLIFLGLRQLWQWRRTADVAVGQTVSAGSRYFQGLAVSLSNPKVVLFLGAFFPQFVNPAADPGPQLALLAVVFVATLGLVDLCYTFAIARARTAFDMAKLKALDGIAGVLLVAGGVVLATARRP